MEAQLYSYNHTLDISSVVSQFFRTLCDSHLNALICILSHIKGHTGKVHCMRIEETQIVLDNLMQIV